MTRTTMIVLGTAAGLTVSGLLVLAYACRTAIPMNPPSDLPQPRRCPPGVSQRRRRLEDALRAEEERQKPWEGRN